MKRWAFILILLAACFVPVHQADAAGPQVIVCIQCHAAQPAQLSQPVKLWQNSIHAEHGITCNACHGGDPMDAVNAMSPARGYRGVPLPAAIPTLCGGCHMGIAKYYMGSAHGRALGRGGPTCVTCHGSHGVVSASLDLINQKNCSTCHAYEKARQVKSAMLKTDGMLKAIDKRIKTLKSQGIVTDSLEKRLFSLRNRSHSLYHSLDINLIRQESAHIQAELEKNNGVGGAGTGPVIGALAIGGALLSALLFYLIRKQLD